MKSINEILDAPVYSEEGNKVGKIDDVILNEATGKVEFLSIQPLSENNRMRVRLTWQEVQSDGSSEALLLNLPKSAAKRLLISGIH